MDSDYNRKPRDFAHELVSEGLVSAEDMMSFCLSYMSADDVRDMLDANELSPRFNDEPEEEEDEEEDDCCSLCEWPLDDKEAEIGVCTDCQLEDLSEEDF